MFEYCYESLESTIRELLEAHAPWSKQRMNQYFHAHKYKKQSKSLRRLHVYKNLLITVREINVVDEQIVQIM